MYRIIVTALCTLALAITATAAPATDGCLDGYTDGGYVFYQSHVQDLGDTPPVYDGLTTGTTGQALRLEALRIYGAPLEYRVHVQGIGWTPWVMDEWAGTKGRALRAEAVEIRMSDHPSVDEAFHVQYRAHVQGIGWTEWVMDGQTAGTTGQALRMEAVEVWLVYCAAK